MSLGNGIAIIFTGVRASYLNLSKNLHSLR
jgi:hypothetical protein